MRDAILTKSTITKYKHMNYIKQNMANKGDIATVIMAAKLKNIRIYEYLMGALLEPDARERERKPMLEYKQKTATVLDSIKRQSNSDDFGDPLALLESEVELNKTLLLLVRKCKSRLEVYHGFGLPVNQCASKWMYQDFPCMMGMRTKDVYQSLPDLCAHVLEKYDCARDGVLTELCIRLEQARNNKQASPTAPISSDSESAETDIANENNLNDKTTNNSTTPDDISDNEGNLEVSENLDEKTNFNSTTPDDDSDDENILVVAEETTYPRVAREIGVEEKQDDKQDDQQDDKEDEDFDNGVGSIAVAKEDKAKTDEPFDESVMELKRSVEDALTQLTPTLSPSKNKHLQEDKPVLSSATDGTAQSGEPTVQYWSSEHEKASMPLPTTTPSPRNVKARKSRTPEQIEQESRRSLVRPKPPTGVRASFRGTPLDPNFGTSPCSVRTNRLTPLRAPVKKAHHPNPEEDEDEEEETPRADVPEVELGPYTKPLWRPRVSHVQPVLEGGEESREKWGVFRSHLETVRQRVISRLVETISATDQKQTAAKEKKRRRRSKCSKRKCKKHAESSGEPGEHSSSDSPRVKSEDLGDDVTSGKREDTAHADVKPTNLLKSSKVKKHKRHIKKEETDSPVSAAD